MNGYRIGCCYKQASGKANKHTRTDGIVEHALAKHQVEEQRRRVALFEDEQRGDRVDGRHERPVEEGLGRGQQRDEPRDAEREQQSSRDEGGDERAGDGEQQDGGEVGEEALALCVEPGLEYDGRQQAEEQDLRVQPGLVRALSRRVSPGTSVSTRRRSALLMLSLQELTACDTSSSSAPHCRSSAELVDSHTHTHTAGVSA